VDDRFAAAAAHFEAAHAADERSVVYHSRLAAWVDRLAPGASEPLRLAARCQHIERWKIPRSDYPDGLSGYKRWRTALGRFHADRAEEVLRTAGYADDVVDRVRALLVKKGLRLDPEVQLFEDAICLVFLEQELHAFAEKHDDEKLIKILQKTWKKMSPKGHAAALELAATLSARARDLVQRAVG
jgi:hypothetical protein